MKLEIVNYVPNRITQTVRLCDESGDPLFEDTINLSRERERRQFAEKLRERYSKLRGRDIEAKLLSLLWELKEEESTEAPVRDSQADRLVRLIEDNGVVLFHDNGKKPFARVPIEGREETWPVRSPEFKRYIAREYWQRDGKAPNSDAINSALNVIEAKACFDGSEYDLHNRVAWHDGALWYDLSDDDWRAVRIDPRGWEIMEHPPILFRRYSHQLAQVEPTKGGNAEDLLGFVNLRDEKQKLLLLVYVGSCFIADIPHPVSQVYGEKGAAKTTLHHILKRLIDPSVVQTLSFPGDVASLVQKVSHHWLACFDNISHISDWQSDAICRASTGEGFTKRELYSDDSDVIYSFRRCVGLNGINIAAHNSDLLDRIILFELELIPPEERREERELLDTFEEAKAGILGGFLDVLSRALLIYTSIKLRILPRMADFTRWGCALAEALGYSQDDLLEAYNANIRGQSEEVLTSNPMAQALLAFMDDKEAWQGTASELLEILVDIAENQLRTRTKTKSWPGAPHILVRRLNELRGNLRDAGMIFEQLPRTGSKGKMLNITKVETTTDLGGKEIGVTSDTSIAGELKPVPPNMDLDLKSEQIGDVTKLQAQVASLIVSPYFVSGETRSQIQGVAGVAGDGKIPKPLEEEVEKDILGIEISEALEIWRSASAPVIHLGPGENCFDLEMLLRGSPKKRHLQAVGEWLRTNGIREEE